jgi:hypothetical protein
LLALRLLATRLQQMTFAQPGLTPEKNQPFPIACDTFLQVMNDFQIRAGEKIIKSLVRHELKK